MSIFPYNGKRPRVHISRVRSKCTCEYCCSVRDAHDDDEMAQDYRVASYSGKDIFNELKVGDSVEYYIIPYEDRHVVYNSSDRKWDFIEEVAKRKLSGLVVSKTDRVAYIGNQPISAAECWTWGLRIKKTPPEEPILKP